MAEVEVREAGPGDLPGIAAVTRATGQGEEWSGADPAYVTHLLAQGRVVVAVREGRVAGFGATCQIGGPGGVSMLCDLFVDPRLHGAGAGRAMLSELWRGDGRRITFSSLHAHALPLYTSFGLDAWWPLLYLRGDVTALTAPAGWHAIHADPDEVAGLELAWTGADRAADHRAWARRPGGTSLLVRRGDRVTGAGTAGGAGDEFGLTHLTLAPAVDDADAVAAVLTALRALAGEGRTARGEGLVCLPAPHPAVRALLAAGWRTSEFDVFMATEPGLLDPRRIVPSPALA
ncbi:MAG TPA: GNAT family N-acetyltransferase [Trebonia sp.]